MSNEIIWEFTRVFNKTKNSFHSILLRGEMMNGLNYVRTGFNMWASKKLKTWSHVPPSRFSSVKLRCKVRHTQLLKNILVVHSSCYFSLSEFPLLLALLPFTNFLLSIVRNLFFCVFARRKQITSIILNFLIIQMIFIIIVIITVRSLSAFNFYFVG